MHSFILSTTVLAVLAFVLAIPLSRAAPLSRLDPPVDPNELTGGGSIRIPDRVVKFVGEDVLERVGAIAPVIEEKDSRTDAEERADDEDEDTSWYARVLSRRTLVDDALKAAAPLTQAVGSKLLPAVEATVQAVSPPAADVVAEAASTVEGALDLIV